MRRLSALIMLLLASPVALADWPQWLGLTRDGYVPAKIEPWKGKLKELWRQPVGEGHCGPIVVNDRVYLHTRVTGKEKEQLACYDAASGKPLWEKSYDRDAYSGLFGSGPRATPAYVNGKIITYGISGTLACFDADKGDLLWSKNLLKEFKAPKLFFGSSGSPLVLGDRVFINVGGKGTSIVAFDLKGDVVWKNLDDGASYSSPIRITPDGKFNQLIFLTQQGLVSVRPNDGALNWRFPFKDKLSESSTTPVLVDGDLLIGSSITLGTVALRLADKDGKPSAAQVWMKPELTCYFSTPIPVGKDHVYAVTGALPPKANAVLRCLDAKTGKQLWQKTGVGTYHASLLRTGDDKLLMLEEKGDLVLIQPDPKAYRELARANICGETWAHPAVTGGRVYIRDKKDLICVQLAN